VFLREVLWASQTVWTFRRKDKFIFLLGIEFSSWWCKSSFHYYTPATYTHSFYITHCRVDDLKTTSMRVKIISVIIYSFQIICKFKLRIFHQVWGTLWRSWLRHCATSRKVAGSIPHGVIWIFHWHNPSGRTVALGSTQLLTEMSTRNISWGVKAAGAWGWQPCHLHVSSVLKSGSLNLLEPSGPVRACNGIALPFSTIRCNLKVAITIYEEIFEEFFVNSNISHFSYFATFKHNESQIINICERDKVLKGQWLARLFCRTKDCTRIFNTGQDYWHILVVFQKKHRIRSFIHADFFF